MSDTAPMSILREHKEYTRMLNATMTKYYVPYVCFVYVDSREVITKIFDGNIARGPRYVLRYDLGDSDSNIANMMFRHADLAVAYGLVDIAALMKNDPMLRRCADDLIVKLKTIYHRVRHV